MKRLVFFASMIVLFIAMGCSFTTVPGTSAPAPTVAAPTSAAPTVEAPTLPPAPAPATAVPATAVPPTAVPPTAVPPTAVPTLPPPPLPIIPTAVPAATSGQFVVTASAANITDNWVVIDSSLTNNNPNAIVFATSNWNPGGSGGTYDNHNIGVWYYASVGKWAVYNQDRAAMPVGASFNILVAPASSSVFILTASAANIAGNYTYIDSTLTNGNPNAIVFITANYNPGGSGGTYNDHATGVWYDSSVGKWAIFNQAKADMPVGAAYNVMIAAASSSVFVLTGSSANIAMNSIYIDSGLTNGNTTALVFITANWNPGGSAGVYNNHATGVWYYSAGSKWAVYNQDVLNMSAGAAFNIMVLNIPR